MSMFLRTFLSAFIVLGLLSHSLDASAADEAKPSKAKVEHEIQSYIKSHQYSKDATCPQIFASALDVIEKIVTDKDLCLQCFRAKMTSTVVENRCAKHQADIDKGHPEAAAGWVIIDGLFDDSLCKKECWSTGVSKQ